MDGVVSPSFAIEMGRVGGLAVLTITQGIYSEPIKGGRYQSVPRRSPTW
jgi:hypothetical protein